MGDPEAPLLLFLHGFPEYAGAWDEVLPAFAGSLPCGGARPARLCALLQAGGRRGLPHQAPGARHAGARRSALAGPAVHLVAHDWGASVAYATAIAAPSRVARLAVINGVHPGPFQRALIEDEAQRAASTYIHDLRDPERRGAAVGQRLREADGAC